MHQTVYAAKNKFWARIHIVEKGGYQGWLMANMHNLQKFCHCCDTTHTFLKRSSRNFVYLCRIDGNHHEPCLEAVRSILYEIWVWHAKAEFIQPPKNTRNPVKSASTLQNILQHLHLHLQKYTATFTNINTSINISKNISTDFLEHGNMSFVQHMINMHQNWKICDP
jgi:hypothetical protein